MFRLHLTLLFVFLFSSFAASAQELMLRGVSIDPVFPQQVKLTWLFNSNIDSVTIYKCTNNCDDENNYNRVAKVEMNINSLTWIDNAASPLSRNYYSIGWSASGKSTPQNNMVLTALPDGNCANSVLLSWNPYINMLGTLDYYLILCREQEDDNSVFTPIGRINGDAAPADRINFEANYLANDRVFELVVQAVSRSGTVSVFSNIVEFRTGTVSNIPVSVRITCVDVIDDQYMEINVTTNNFLEPFQKLYLYKDKPSVESAMSLKIIDSAIYSPTNRYRFTDRDVDPKSGLYYYMAIADNKCKPNDTSNVLTNIYLQGWREEKYRDGVSFSRRGFYPSTESYELFRIVHGREYSIEPSVRVFTNYYIDVLEFLNDGVVTVYKVLANTGCSSNTVTIDHEPIIEFPNAFFPKDVKIENRTFYPIIRFPSEINYSFTIYNRWGQEVFRTTRPPIYGDYENMQGRWDGTFQGKDCPAGIYAYKISYIYNSGGGQYSHTGSFMLVR